MKSTVIIVHGCPSNPENHPAKRTYDKHWLAWAYQQLTEKGIPVHLPILPSPWDPEYEAFKAEFEKCPIDKDTILVGHSCGCAFLVRWLGETKKKIKKLILVAPWKIPDSPDSKRHAFYTYPIDPKIKERVESITIFTSDNEAADGKKSVRMFHEALGGKIIELKGRGHYTQRNMGTSEFPELLKEILGTL